MVEYAKQKIEDMIRAMSEDEIEVVIDTLIDMYEDKEKQDDKE